MIFVAAGLFLSFNVQKLNLKLRLELICHAIIYSHFVKYMTCTLHLQELELVIIHKLWSLVEKYQVHSYFFSEPSGPCPVNDVVGLNNEEENKIIVDGTCYM